MKLTIFTPTYNRLSQLPGLFDSIKVAMNSIGIDDEVEWIIVDDGSKMDISPYIDSFKKINKLEVKLIKKGNGGKHTAFNVAIEQADSDIFVCIDDDDRLTPNAIGDIFKISKEFFTPKQQIGAVVGRVINQSGELLGRTIFDSILISNTIEIRDRYHFWGEPEVFFTKILKRYRFNVYSDERFLTEAYVFDKMSIEFPFVYTNIPLMVKVFLPDGLTDNQLKIRMQCPIGCEAYYYQRKNLCKGFRNKLKATINRRRFCRYSAKRLKRPWDIYELIACPLAWAISLRDMRIEQKSNKPKDY